MATDYAEVAGAARSTARPSAPRRTRREERQYRRESRNTFRRFHIPPEPSPSVPAFGHQPILAMRFDNYGHCVGAADDDLVAEATFFRSTSGRTGMFRLCPSGNRSVAAVCRLVNGTHRGRHFDRIRHGNSGLGPFDAPAIAVIWPSFDRRCAALLHEHDEFRVNGGLELVADANLVEVHDLRPRRDRRFFSVRFDERHLCIFSGLTASTRAVSVTVSTITPPGTPSLNVSDRVVFGGAGFGSDEQPTSKTVPDISPRVTIAERKGLDFMDPSFNGDAPEREGFNQIFTLNARLVLVRRPSGTRTARRYAGKTRSWLRQGLLDLRPTPMAEHDSARDPTGRSPYGGTGRTAGGFEMFPAPIKQSRLDEGPIGAASGGWLKSHSLDRHTDHPALDQGPIAGGFPR